MLWFNWQYFSFLVFNKIMVHLRTSGFIVSRKQYNLHLCFISKFKGNVMSSIYVAASSSALIRRRHKEKIV